MTPLELAAKCAPLIATAGSSFYFHPDTLAVGKQHDLGGMRFYVLGRGGVLGDVEAQVVGSAFGYFNPELIDKLWTTSKQRLAPREAARLFLGCNVDLGRAKLGEIDAGVLERFCDAADAVNDAIDPAGLALYAGIDSEPKPDDPPARALHLSACLREARGSAHLAAIVTLGLDPVIAHYIRRPDFYEAFGWSEPPTVHPDHHELLERVDRATDDMMARPFSVIDPAGADAMLSGLTEIRAALAA